jgi:hypothetical protein
MKKFHKFWSFSQPLGRLRQEGHKFKVSFGYTVRPFSKK